MGCGPEDGTPPDEPDKPPPMVSKVVVGDLGFSSFIYQCAGSSDPYCNGTIATNGFPIGQIPPIAVGAKFQMQADEGTGAAYTSTFADESRFDTSFDPNDNVVLDAKAPGITAIFSTRKVDFVHLRALKIDHVHVEALGAGSSGFRAVAEAADNTLLAGALPCTWSIKDSNVARLTSDPSSNVATFTPVASGSTTLHLDMAGFRADFPIQVN